MYYTASGQPSENGPYEIVDGNLRPRGLKDGEHVGFDVTLMDHATGSRTFHDAKAVEPASIDEAVQQTLATMAKNHNCSVKELLASMKQKDVEELVAKIATEFVSGKAGEGIAKQFATDGAIMDAARSYLASVAVAKTSAAAFQASTASFDEGARAARKHLVSQAWKKGR